MTDIRRFAKFVVCHLPPSEVSIRQENFLNFCRRVGVDKEKSVTTGMLSDIDLMRTVVFPDGCGGHLPRCFSSWKEDHLKLIRFHLV